MTKTDDFRKSLQFVLKWEVGNAPNGGYTNDPSDPGGETKWGISKAAFPTVDIVNLTAESALQIYATSYWDAAGCDSLTFPLSTVVFDSAVTSGVGRATGWLRAVSTARDYLNLRRSYLLDLCNKKPNLMIYRDGWMNRITDLQKFVEINSIDSPEVEIPQWGSLG